MELDKRVNQWFIFQKKLGKTQKSIAEDWGVSVQYISQLKTGKVSVGFDVIKRILDFDKKLNSRWLIFGEGEMYSSDLITSNDVSDDDYYLPTILKANFLNEPKGEYLSIIDSLIKSNQGLIKSVNELRTEIKELLKETKSPKASKYK